MTNLFLILKARIELQGLTDFLREKVNKAWGYDQISDEEYQILLAIGQ